MLKSESLGRCWRARDGYVADKLPDCGGQSGRGYTGPGVNEIVDRKRARSQPARDCARGQEWRLEIDTSRRERDIRISSRASRRPVAAGAIREARRSSPGTAARDCVGRDPRVSGNKIVRARWRPLRRGRIWTR